MKKLLAAHFIREVWYPVWLANVVMVRKSSGKWRMYTDYTNLNKACLKDPYLLPSIDQLVNGASKYGLMSFMDTYSRYNQIRMHLEDKAKTTFIANSGSFYYKVMPFRLKNSNVTYQRLMDRIFKDHLGRELEIYIAGIVIKSTTKGQHCDALAQVFVVLKKHKLKLNLEKYLFGVQADEFVGFMLTHRGIEANLEKCEAIINMRSLVASRSSSSWLEE
ncbi:hypothetical protein CR513_11917, partial [Mucuna pruriens]